MPRLQVALDLTDLEKALSVASRVAEVCDHELILLEAGTPLIKAFGMAAIRRLAEAFSDIPVVADMKIADVGDLEAELAISSGARYVTVLAQASDETIASAVEAAHRLGGKVIVDLMAVLRDPISRTVELLRRGVDAVCYHVPIDVQRARGIGAGGSIGMVKVLKTIGVREVGVAGGITPENARALAEAGADVLVVGRYVYSSQDPGQAAQSILASCATDC
ncbi:MAG: orotidine 5'-phosphate decarboxylase / HUMPS family protein [Thermofilaceae archaeon]